MHFIRSTVAHTLVARLELKILGHADFDSHQFSTVTRDAKRAFLGVISACKAGFNIARSETSLLAEILVCIRHLHGLNCLFDLCEIVVSGEPAAGPMLRPLVLDQAGARKVCKHPAHNLLGNRMRASTVLWGPAVLRLRP